MPTSSQAMIVLTDEGEDPRIPRRHFSTLVANNIPFIKTAGRNTLPSLTANMSGFPDGVDVNGYRGTMSYDVKSRSLRWEVTTSDMKPVVPLTENRRPDCTYRRTPEMLDRQDNENERKIRDDRRERLENLGFRRRRTADGLKHINGHKIKDINACSPTVIPKNAKFMPTPPGTKPCALTPHTIPVVNQGSYGDGTTLNTSTFPNKSVKEKPKSLLDELKESISYDSKLMPSMQLRKSLPPSSPNSIVFSLRNNDEYSHKEIKDLIESKSGVKARTIQFDPVNIKTGSSDTPSRWIVQCGSAEDTRCILQTGFEMDGEKIIVRLLDDVHKIEYTAYKLKMEEERKQREREAMMCILRKSRRQRGNTKQNGRARI